MSSVAGSARGCPPARRARARRPSALTVYRWELRKLVSQKRTYLGLGLAVLLPLIFVVSQLLRGHPPRGGDNIFASQITQSGLATPVLMLTFLSLFFLPLIAALVAGDIVAAEDGNGTLKTILTRSVDRGQVFAAKALAAITYGAARGLPVGRRRDRRRRRLVGLPQRAHALRHVRLGARRRCCSCSRPTPAS